jgi:alditol oxidase
MTDVLTNWAGNVRFSARTLHRPESVDELRRLVAASPHIRGLGTGHSFNALADSPGDLVTVAGLPVVIDIEPDAGRPTEVARPSVNVSAGLRYGELSTALQARGFALRNLGSLPHISVAGACATGTHGSGVGNGNLATSVLAVELVGPEGDLVRLSRASDPDRFAGAVVALGALGIVTRLTLELVPTYDVRQYVYEDLPGEQLRAHTEEILAAGYSVSLFTSWQRDAVEQVWRKERISSSAVEADAGGSGGSTPPRLWHGARLAEAARHPLPGVPATYCTEQLGRPGPWYARLPHFRMEFTPSFGDELQAEYLLPREHAAEAFDAVAGLRALLAPVLLVSEIRTVAADDLWLSPSYRRDCLALHFTWVNDETAVRPVLAALEERLAPWAPRPHWGKLFSAAPDVVAASYPRMGDFGTLRRDLDPGGKFGGPLVDRYAPAARG